jgi:DNA-binding transcriptional MerR regulator
MARDTNGNKDGYGIGAVAKITGLTDHTIRVWERRYQAVVARRTDSGRRIYSAADVEKLGLLKQLTDRGIAISKIASKSNAALRKAAIQYEQVAITSLPDNVRVAILGELVRTQLVEDPGSLDIVIANNDPETFVTDLGHQPVDIVVFENPILDKHTVKQLKSYVALGHARYGMFIYNYGQKQDIDRAIRSGVLSLKSPVSVSTIHAMVNNQPAAAAKAGQTKTTPAKAGGSSNWHFSGSIKPRRFTQQQLAYLAGISSSIECECPQNLAELVSNLTAFEIYSAQCANRDRDDAALHHYLHQTCAEARTLIETALERVVDAEGISL